MIRILIVDDQRIVREGIKILLEKKADIQIIGDACDGKEAIQKIESLQPDVVLLDINMPGIDGLIAIERIKLVCPQIKVIMLSSYEDESYVQKSTELGAKGYLLKNASSQELEWSIKLVHQGYSTIKSELLEKQFARSTVSKAAMDLDFDRANSLNGSNTRSATEPHTRLQQVHSSVATVPQRNQSKQKKLDFLLPKNSPDNQYSKKYSNYSKPNSNSRFHSVTVSRIKKTMMSFEFKLLVLAILFCLGFLMFIALS